MLCGYLSRRDAYHEATMMDLIAFKKYMFTNYDPQVRIRRIVVGDRVFLGVMGFPAAVTRLIFRLAKVHNVQLDSIDIPESATDAVGVYVLGARHLCPSDVLSDDEGEVI